MKGLVHAILDYYGFGLVRKSALSLDAPPQFLA